RVRRLAPPPHHLHTVESVKDAIVAVDERSQILLFNPAAEKMFGLRAVDAIGQPLAILLPSGLSAGHELKMQQFARAADGPRAMAGNLEIHGRRSDGTLFPIESSISKTDIQGKTQLTAVLRDVTEQTRVEHEMRDLSRRLIRAHEDERALLARELHDDVTQRLAVLAIEVGRAEIQAKNAAQAAAMLAVREGLTRLSEDIHSLAYQLHPSILRELGLAEGLRAECERRSRQGQFEISFDLNPLSPAAGKDAELCLFRVAQEALNNVARHARASATSVTLRPMEGGLLLAVHDDGVGFVPEDLDGRMHLGLVGMRERVKLVHGTLDVESAPGQGTTIVAWVPGQGEAP
ncbi:MAG: PAS domain-containing sensor histidine kinase, partial [Rhodoferax sp.]